MQYTLRNVPPALDRALRERARREGRSLNDVLLDALRLATGLAEPRVRHRSLNGIRGTWREDPEFDAAIADHDRVDDELWK
jgi:plasmid stability protein